MIKVKQKEARYMSRFNSNIYDEETKKVNHQPYPNPFYRKIFDK